MKRFLNLFRNERAKAPVFIVSGLPRSGTSLMMMVLEAAGIPPVTDHERNPDQDNPRGYYEFERVKKLKDGDILWLENAPGKVVKVISALLPYLPADYEYKVFFMRRSLAEILASQRKMLENRGEDPEKVSDAEMAQFFEVHLRQMTDWLAKQENFSTLYVDYNQMLAEPEAQIQRVNTFLGGKMDEVLMLDAIDPGLYRQRAK